MIETTDWGNHYSVKARYKFDLSERWKSYAGLTFHYRDSINGQDDSLLLGEPPTIYPASITNPNLYGGEKISGRVGFFVENLRRVPPERGIRQAHLSKSQWAPTQRAVA